MTNQPPTLHLVSGLPASGKTTYSEGLRVDSSAVLFSLDRWLITAYGRYSLEEVGQEEHTRRVLACRELIWASASELLRRSTPVILDDGFFLRQHRQRYVAMGAGSGATTTIHHIHASLDVIKRRLEIRNRRRPPYNFHIHPEILVGFLGVYEVPSESEGATIVRICTADEGIPNVEVH